MRQGLVNPNGRLRKLAMADPTLANASGRSVRWRLAVEALSLCCVACWQASAAADKFAQAVNYVFTGRIDPPDPPQIVDRESCVVVMREPKFNKYVRYYLSRFNMGEALFDKKYSGSRVLYELDVKGDEPVIEYLSPDKKSVVQSFRSAQISLPGDIDLTQKALKIIFTDYCKEEKPKPPF
jgi:hypothetical protein